MDLIGPFVLLAPAVMARSDAFLDATGDFRGRRLA